MKKILIIPVGLTALMLLLGNSAFAYRGDPSVRGPNYSSERHALMTVAFENSDYEAWKELMSDRGNTRVTQVVTEENFDKFAEVHNLMLEGKIDEAKELRKELGLGFGPFQGKGRNGPRDGSGYGRNR
jgi:hypothetical protein